MFKLALSTFLFCSCRSWLGRTLHFAGYWGSQRPYDLICSGYRVVLYSKAQGSGSRTQILASSSVILTSRRGARMGNNRNLTLLHSRRVATECVFSTSPHASPPQDTASESTNRIRHAPSFIHAEFLKHPSRIHGARTPPTVQPSPFIGFGVL